MIIMSHVRIHVTLSRVCHTLKGMSQCQNMSHFHGYVTLLSICHTFKACHTVNVFHTFMSMSHNQAILHCQDMSHFQGNDTL